MPHYVPVLDFEGPEDKPDSSNVEGMLSLGKVLGLGKDDADTEELVEEHKDEVMTKDLQDLHQVQQKPADVELSSGEEP